MDERTENPESNPSNFQHLNSKIEELENDISQLKAKWKNDNNELAKNIKLASELLTSLSVDLLEIDSTDDMVLDDHPAESLNDHASQIDLKDLGFIETCLGLSALATGVSVFVIEIDNIQISRLKIALIFFISVINLAVMWAALWSLALTFDIETTMPDRKFSNIESPKMKWYLETLRGIKLSWKQVSGLLFANLGPYTILVYALLFWLFLSIGLTIWMPFN